MDDPPARPPLLRLPTAAVLTGVLLASVVVYAGYHAWIAFDPDDTNHLETTLALAIDREVRDGPSTLYGPFSGDHPFVLIHAPLYYRLAGAITWAIDRAGFDPVLSALYVGRALSFAGMVALVATTGLIARRDGGSGLAGLWAACLVAGSPVFSSFGVAVRPDAMGIALQTIGLGLALSALREVDPRPRGWRLPLAGLCFALAACMKQHLLVAAGVGTVMVIASAARGRLGGKAAMGFVACLVLVPLAYFGWEQFVTRGAMARSVFLLPSRLRTASPASWEHVGTVFFESSKLSLGLFVLALGVFVAGPRRSLVGSQLDATLWVLMLAEFAAMVPLCKGSDGAWTNYAQPGTVWASILVARAAGRVLASPTLGLRTLAIWVGALAFLGNDARLAAISFTNGRENRALLAKVLEDPAVAGSSPDRRYFVDLPQFTRMYGRVGLAHDHWLYSAFESEHLAEPRSSWLARALTGPVHVVIARATPTGDDLVTGLSQRLPDLGYRRANAYVQYSVWVRD